MEVFGFGWPQPASPNVGRCLVLLPPCPHHLWGHGLSPVGTSSPGPGGAERGAPTSAELGVAAGAEDAEEAGLQGVAGVIAGDVGEFLGEESTVRKGDKGMGVGDRGRDVRRLPPGQRILNGVGGLLWEGKVLFWGAKWHFLCMDVEV